MRRRNALLLTLGLVACGEGGEEEGGAATVEPRPTATARPPTPTPRPDYGALARRLVVPLGPLIVAVRDRSPTQGARLVAFNEAANGVLAAIEGDTSTGANRLHSTVVNVREAALRGDAATLERERLTLLDVR